MPTDDELVATIRTQTLTVMAEISANPKPSYTIDGQTVSWNEYMAQCRETIAWCDGQLAGSEPFEVVSQGFT